MEEEHKNFNTANKFLNAASTTLLFFGILNILKTAYPAIGTFLAFYKPIGPLLGLYITSLFVFFVLLFAFSIFRLKNQCFSYWFFVISIVVFFFLVFPPIFEPVAHFLGG